MKTLEITTQESEHEIIHHIQKSSRILLFFAAGLIVSGVVLGMPVLSRVLYLVIFVIFPIFALILLLIFAFKTIIIIDRVSGQLTVKRMFLTHCYHSRQFFLNELSEVRCIEVPGIDSGDMTYIYLIDVEEKRHLLYRNTPFFGKSELKSFGENLAKELRLPFTLKRTVSHPYYG